MLKNRRVLRCFSHLCRERFVRRACLDNAWRDAARRPSRFSAASLARERRRDVFFCRPLCPCLYARSALRLVRSDVWPLRGGLRLTPAFRALDKPIAIACFVDRAPCLPSLTWRISSRTNSPACVEGALPWRFFSCALWTVCRSGIRQLLGDFSESSRIQRSVVYKSEEATAMPATSRGYRL